MEALLNLPTHDASNFAKYKQSRSDNQQLGLHKQVGHGPSTSVHPELRVSHRSCLLMCCHIAMQEACGPPKYQPPTIFSTTTEPEGAWGMQLHWAHFHSPLHHHMHFQKDHSAFVVVIISSNAMSFHALWHSTNI